MSDHVSGDRICPQCSANDPSIMANYSVAPWRIVRCGQCGFVYLHNPPDYEQLESELAFETTSAAEHERRKRERPFTKWLAPQLQPTPQQKGAKRRELYRRLFPAGPILDVGCGGSGGLEGPYEPYGIEISSKLHKRSDELMRQRGGYAVQGPAAEAIAEFPDRHFSGVIMSSVLEHEVQPAKLLAGVARVLRGDGRAYIRVPNFGSLNRMVRARKWCGFRNPDHVNYFTLASLRRMADHAGLVMSLRHPLRLPVDDNINAILKIRD